MLQNPRFQIRLGGALLDSQVPSNLNTVTAFLIELGINGPANRLELQLGRSDGLTIVASDGLPESPLPVAGGLVVSRGAPISVALGYEDVMMGVFAGQVHQILPGIEHLQLIAFDGARKLQQLRINQTHEQQTAGDIVAGLAATAGVAVGHKEDGIELPFYVIDARKSGYEHILELAEKNGYDFYFDDENRLIFEASTEAQPVKTLRYGVDVLAMEVAHRNARFERAEIRGESPASSQGIEKAHWLVKSFEDALGVAGAGSPVVHLQDPAVKTKAAADAVAAGRLNTIRAESVRGRARVLMSPDVRLGDVVRTEGFPDDALNAPYHIRGLQHVYAHDKGFISELRLRGIAAAGLGLGL